LGFEPPRRTIHALRHTFALNYIRMGGGEFRLQKVLGHTTLAMTRKYVNLA
jgi:integrase/recombinase XerD